MLVIVILLCLQDLRRWGVNMRVYVNTGEPVLTYTLEKKEVVVMSRIQISAINQFCRSCQVSMGAATYTIMATMALSYMGVLTASYYVSRQDKPELALLCYHTQGKALGMSGELADLRFVADVQKFGVEMISQYDKEIHSFRRI